MASNISHADTEVLVDKKGGPEDMYEFAREADIVITCMALTNETVSTSHCYLFINLLLTTCILLSLLSDQICRLVS